MKPFIDTLKSQSNFDLEEIRKGGMLVMFSLAKAIDDAHGNSQSAVIFCGAEHSPKRKWWQFWKKDRRAKEPDVASGRATTYLEPRVKSFDNKTRICVNCNMAFPEGALQCAKCGSTRFIWE